MKKSYRGHEIEVTREPSMMGDKMLFWSIIRESDGYAGSDTVRDFVGYLKEQVDAELAEKDPWAEGGDSG